MHQPRLRALRDMLECVSHILREDDAVQGPEKVLREVRGLRQADMPEARPRPVRVQRMRQAERLPAQEALLHRGRRAGQLPGHPQRREARSAGRRGHDSRHERRAEGPRPARKAVDPRRDGREAGSLPRVQRKERLQLRQLAALRREAGRHAPHVPPQAAETGRDGSEDRREMRRNRARRFRRPTRDAASGERTRTTCRSWGSTSACSPWRSTRS